MAFKQAFSYLTSDDRAALMARAERRLMPANALVLKQHAAHDGIFVIADGIVRVQHAMEVMRHRLPAGLSAEQRAAFLKANPSDGERTRLSVTLSRLGRGAIFGELSFLDGEPTSAAIVAETPVTILRVTGEHIRDLAASDPAFGSRFYQSLARAMAQRIRRINVARQSALGKS